MTEKLHDGKKKKLAKFANSVSNKNEQTQVRQKYFVNT